MREKILKRGEQLFLSKGFSGFSYADISKDLGVKNAAIHYHFPSKKDLIIAILEQEQKYLQTWKEKENQPGIDALELFDTSVRHIYEKRILSKSQVCVIGSSAMSHDSMPLDAVEIARNIIDELVDWFAFVLKQGIAQGKMKLQGSPHEEAKIITSSLAGALQLSRITGKKYFFSIRDQIRLKLTNE